LPSREEAEDLCHETFARALKADGALRDRNKLRPYLYRIASNLLSDHVRRRGLVTSESDLGEHADVEAFADRQAPGPEAAAHFAELKRHLTELLGGLPADQRKAFELGVLQRHPYAEVCAATGWSLAKVKVNVYRARKRLMAGLREYHPDPEHV
jgi:RNA polymerase sigma-70 factor (ECF subfamily)